MLFIHLVVLKDEVADLLRRMHLVRMRCCARRPEAVKCCTYFTFKLNTQSRAGICWPSCLAHPTLNLQSLAGNCTPGNFGEALQVFIFYAIVGRMISDTEVELKVKAIQYYAVLLSAAELYFTLEFTLRWQQQFLKGWYL